MRLMTLSLRSVAAAIAGLAPLAVFAQAPAPQPPPPLPASEIHLDLACAPHMTYVEPDRSLRVIGSQDTVVKQMFGPGDLLVISAGSNAGLRVGQQYFVRRLPQRFGARKPDRLNPVSVHTAGWVRIFAVDEEVATASILHACEGILANDYLEPFVAPVVAARKTTDGQVRYENLGIVLGGDEDKRAAGTGEFMTIDRGSDHGIVLGERFVVFRDKRTGSPLVEIADATAVTVRPETSTIQIGMARDAVMTGDLVAVKR